MHRPSPPPSRRTQTSSLRTAANPDGTSFTADIVPIQISPGLRSSRRAVRLWAAREGLDWHPWELEILARRRAETGFDPVVDWHDWANITARCGGVA